MAEHTPKFNPHDNLKRKLDEARRKHLEDKEERFEDELSESDAEAYESDQKEPKPIYEDIEQESSWDDESDDFESASTSSEEQWLPHLAWQTNTPQGRLLNLMEETEQ